MLVIILQILPKCRVTTPDKNVLYLHKKLQILPKCRHLKALPLWGRVWVGDKILKYEGFILAKKSLRRHCEAPLGAKAPRNDDTYRFLFKL